LNSGPAKVDVSLILACYNEEQIFTQSVKEILEILDNTRFTYEIIFVDDCSKDRTRDLISEAIAQYPDKPLRRLLHEKNKGRGGTVADGIKIARGDVAGFIDIDLEVHARYIPSCILAIQNGADVAIAHRVYTFQPKSVDRWLMSKGYSWLVRHLLGVDLFDTETGYKFFDREKILLVLDEIEDQRWFWDTEIMVRSYLRGLKIAEIPALFIRRFDKQSTVSGIRDSVEYFGKLWRFRGAIKKEIARTETGHEETDVSAQRSRLPKLATDR
jgi:glycosyltransferase involved in cell wall biosynthesis